MDKDLLLRIFGPSALLFHYDTLVYDRWNWLISRLPAGKDLRALDIGCGNGAFTMGLALRGYDCLGLSWDAESQKRSGERAAICGADKAKFEICVVDPAVPLPPVKPTYAAWALSTLARSTV